MRRFALLLGSAGGSDTSTLAYAHSDVLRMRELLDRPGWDVENNVLAPETLRKPDDVDALIRKLRERVRPDDLLFVYYAGHAVHRPRKRHDEETLYLVMEQSSVRQGTNLLPVSTLIDFCFGESAPAHTILALDCCYAGETKPKSFKAILDDLKSRLRPNMLSGGHSRTLLAASAEGQAAYEGVRSTITFEGEPAQVGGGYFTTTLSEVFQGLVPKDKAPTDGLLTMDWAAGWIKSQFPRREGIALRSQPMPPQVAEVVHGGSLVVTWLPSAFMQVSSRQPTLPIFLPRPEQLERKLNFLPAPLWRISDAASSCPINKAVITPHPLVAALDRGACGIEVHRQSQDPVSLSVDAGGQGFAISPDGRRLAVEIHHVSRLSAQGGIGIYDSDSLIQRAWLPELGSLLAFTSDGHHIAAVDPTTNALRLWQWQKQTMRTPDPTAGHRGRVSHLAVGRDSFGIAVTGGADGRVLLWQFGRKEADALKAVELPTSDEGQVTALAISPTNDWVAGGFGTGTVRLWRVETGETRVIRTVPMGSLISALAFSDDGRQLAVGRSDGSVWVLSLSDADLPTALVAPNERLNGMIGTIAFAPRSQRWTLPLVAIGTQAGVLHIASSTNVSLALATYQSAHRIIKAVWLGQTHSTGRLLMVDAQIACELGLTWSESK